MRMQERPRPDEPSADFAANPRALQCLLVLVLTGLFTALAGNACAQTTPFVPIDLGTLGGRDSFACAINPSGQIVGGSWMEGNTGPPGCSACPPAYHAFSWTPTGGMIDLGTLRGSGSAAYAVNASGQIVGASDGHAFSWTPEGGMINLTGSALTGPAITAAVAVNDAGQVVGQDLWEEAGGFFWTTTNGVIDLDSNELSVFFTFDGYCPRGRVLNAVGQVVGWRNIFGLSFFPHAFSWTLTGGMIDLSALGAPFTYRSSAFAVNDSGQVVGFSQVVGVSGASGGTHAFSWTPTGGMIDLGTLGGSYSAAYAVNASGQVVGESDVVENGPRHAFSWTQSGGMIDLGTLGGFGASPFAVNAKGQVVGESRIVGQAELHAFSWTEKGGMVDLGTLGGTLARTGAVNDSGQVVGWSTTAGDATTHAVLWRPISDFGCATTLAGCNLRGANLAGAYLKARNLSDANLKQANLARANLSGANVTNVNMMEANLTNANLAGAQLNRTNVKDVIWSNTICPDGTNSDANGSTCVGHF